jgi:hypothetical protein
VASEEEGVLGDVGDSDADSEGAAAEEVVMEEVCGDQRAAD